MLVSAPQDCLISIPLGMLLVLVQVAVSKNDLYSSLFEIVIATINSFLAAALASSGKFCFAAVASGSVVLILPYVTRLAPCCALRFDTC